MGDTNLEISNVTNDLIRNLFSTLDKPAFWLLGLMYQLFFNVASADLFSNETILNFYKRVQLIIGVVMMFELAVTILRGIISPETFTDTKNGVANLIKRVAISLILLTLLTPISIPGAKNEWERQLNNNGFLFGTLYSLQHRILNNNTLGRLILGNDDSAESFTSTDADDKDSTLARSSRIFTSTILKGFYRINLLPEEDRPHPADGKDPAIYNENRVCQDIDDEVLKAYTRIDADPGEIISMITQDCEYDASQLNPLQSVISIASPKLAGKKRYVFAYMPFIPAVVAFIFVFILLNFTVEVAVRAVKLSVLRLIAPIPIISYMDPKGGKDNAFNSWVKALTTTYLDLFIRLATVYFILFLIQDMIVNGIYINNASGILGILSFILILVGLFVFAKQAPKFIKQVLGIKDEGGKFLSGITDLASSLAMSAGIIGGAVSKGVGNYENSHNFGKALLAGLTGGIGGGYNAGKAYLNSKDANAASIMKANKAYNLNNYSNASDESTFLGRGLASLQGVVGAKNALQRMDDKIKDYGAANAAWKRISTALDSDDHDFTYAGPSVVDSHGNVLFQSGQSYSTKTANDILSRMKDSGQYTATEIEAMEDAKKAMQKTRFDEIRTMGASGVKLHGTEDQIFQGAETVYKVGKKYQGDDDEVFKAYQHATSVADASISMGPDFKGATFKAERQADAIKNSAEYARAQANAKRADDKK